MKRIIIFMMAAAAMVAVSCEKTPSNPPVEVQISLMLDGEIYAEDGITVALASQGNSASYEAVTTAGIAKFTVIPGLYNATASFRTTEGTTNTVYNGTAAITVVSGGENAFELNLSVSQTNPLIIKELYTGGCQKNDESGYYRHDSYVILYNNSDAEIDISNVAFAFATPSNSNATNKYIVDGQLTYASQGWIPAGWDIWWFDSQVTLAPYSQIVVAIDGAINHTETYTNSVDLSDGSYYAMYDPEAFGEKYNQARYPNPSDAILSSHYLQTYLYGMGNAWPISDMSPAFYILEYADIEAYSMDDANYDRTENANLPVVKVKNEWVRDAVEVFTAGKEADNQKRFPANIDAGHIYYTTNYGYTIYRNVDKEATEALAENEGKLVYNYTGGTDGVDATYGNTDPSGIDAEASIANGAHIIYKDTNNSSADFHQRRVASLKK